MLKIGIIKKKVRGCLKIKVIFDLLQSLTLQPMRSCSKLRNAKLQNERAKRKKT
jgi:hypothetical protein